MNNWQTSDTEEKKPWKIICTKHAIKGLNICTTDYIHLVIKEYFLFIFIFIFNPPARDSEGSDSTITIVLN